MKNAHSLSIVGPNLPTAESQLERAKLNKELQQKRYQEELQEQIREREEYRRREQDPKGRRSGSLNRKILPSNNRENIASAGMFPWNQQEGEQRQAKNQLDSLQIRPQFLSSD